jgi:hypothetical protein
MIIQNTKKLQNFIVNEEISGEGGEYIEQIIDAFSEYIVAINSEYVYNKTYLGAHVEKFIKCQKILKLKYQILMDKIMDSLVAFGIEKECIITIDNAWKVDKGEVRLLNSFNPDIVTKNKIQFEIELIHGDGCVIAEEITINGEYENTIDVCISNFIERRKEFLKDEK